MSPESKLHCIVSNLLALTTALLVLPGGSALGAEWTLERDQLVEQPKPYSPYVDQHFPQRVFFGDTHFHSSLSVDSGMVGNTIDLDAALAGQGRLSACHCKPGSGREHPPKGYPRYPRCSDLGV